ncbi:MAG: carbohydrate ABC transporter permease [Actinomycetota bacterium]
MAVAQETGRYRPSRAGRLAAWIRRHRFEILLISPLILYVVVLTIAPIIDTFKVSLTHPRTLAFPSGANYQANFGSANFREATVNTMVVAVLSLTLELGVGLAVALALHARFRGQGFVRTVMLVPLGVPTIVSGAIMLLIFARSGYMNSVLGGVSGLVSDIPGVDWAFRNLSWTTDGGLRTLLTVAIADMWKVLPIVSLIFLAGLQSIPEDIYEAADVDGATKWQKFARITFPLLIPYITMALILRSIDAFRIFELALVLSGAIEPVLGTYIWDRFGPPTNDPFTASSASIVLFGMIMVFIILYLRFVATRAEVAR